MFHSTSHQMMRELDTESPYRVQFKTSAGYDMAKLDNELAHENAANLIEIHKVELATKKAHERAVQSQAHKDQIEIVKEAHATHTAAIQEHRELEETVIQKKRAAREAKKILDDHLSQLENLKSTANRVEKSSHSTAPRIQYGVRAIPSKMIIVLWLLI
jgi:hypothetical protein